MKCWVSKTRLSVQAEDWAKYGALDTRNLGLFQITSLSKSGHWASPHTAVFTNYHMRKRLNHTLKPRGSPRFLSFFFFQSHCFSFLFSPFCSFFLTVFLTTISPPHTHFHTHSLFFSYSLSLRLKLINFSSFSCLDRSLFISLMWSGH